MRDLESSLACIVCLHSLLRDCVGEDCRVPMHYSDREERSCTRTHTHSTHARTQAST